MNNTIENLRRHEKSFMPMQMSEISNYSRVFNQPNDGSYLNSAQRRNQSMNSGQRQPRGRCFNCNQEGHIRRNCPIQSRNVQNDYYRLNFDPNSPVNRSTPINRNVSFNNRANTNNVNDEIEEQELNYVDGFIGEVNENNLIKGHKGSFTTANGQPLEVMDKVKTKLKIGMNEEELDVFVANDLKHECLVSLDFMGKVEGTKRKIKEMHSSLGGEEVPTKNSKKQSVNTVEFTDEEQKVKTKTCSEPFREPPRRVPFHMKDEIKKQLDELLEAGIIEPSNSELATALDSYPIPRLDETTDKFYEIEVFTTLDMTSGYYQVKMDPKDKEKTAMARWLHHSDCINLDYSKIASPLFKATKKGKKFEFDERCEDAFNQLKDCLTDSDIGLGAVLSQKRDGEWKQIAYWSRQLIKSEQNYSATEKEALAFVEAMEHFRPGKLNGNAHSLSRCPIENDEKVHEKNLDADFNVIIFTDCQTDQQTEDKNIAQLIEWNNLSDSRTDVKGLTGELRTLWLQWNRLTVINGVLYRSWKIDGDIFRYQCVVPIDKRPEILKQIHDSEFGGHFGCVGTTGKIESKYYWPSQHKHIAEYIENCLKCQESKTSGLMGRAPLQPIITSRPFQLVTCDILGPLNTTERGAEYILDDWDLLLNKLAFAYRTAVHRATGYTPFESVYGRQPKLPIYLFFENCSDPLELYWTEYVKQVKDRLKQIFETVRKDTEIKVIKTKILYDRNVRGANFSLKDTVWLIYSERKKGKNPKLPKLWKGPFEIIEILGPVNYKIKAINGKKRIVVYRNRLKRCLMNLNLTLNDKTCSPSQEADVTLI
ncbi:unnamed protein product [Brachionus calyciflorus]|uniref:CCHC-type domain-containing protein n=1 Tax=Brachionus calyciflorus TaxID=104777 RepID=A0A813WE59_9BILA|nr:unnamed protein product [Brachionus calyciflorus]